MEMLSYQLLAFNILLEVINSSDIPELSVRSAKVDEQVGLN